ncbi:helix-turn-helix domain-containing protein [uncultured Roseovarius sp.]|uniref:helix-turn-helix transcriptional regulator n=1 Tax=uncultured Roseovarius sp. TaxID=293344 RepID=UPI0026045A63|nr:helix-turn-helix domain-containing protein [uncultured Roseovarius sp.]
MSLNTTNLYLSVEQVAKRFSVSKDTIWRWKRNGEFPAPVKLGGTTTRWRLSDIEEYESQLICGLITYFDLEPTSMTLH